MKTKIFLIIVFTAIYGCSDNVSKSRIGSYLSENCKSQECDIDLSLIVKEPWDTVYLFDQSSSFEFIRNTIKTDYNFVDIGRKIIFVNNKEIIYSEDEFPNPELTKRNELIFNLGYNSVLKLDRKNAHFKVLKEDKHFIIQHKPY